MATILVTGGTGLVGSLLVKELTKAGHEVIIASRSAAPATYLNVKTIQWDPSQLYIDIATLQRVHYIVNLAGAGIADKRWTPQRKQEIVQSRVQAARTIVENLRKIPHQVKAVINSSAIGWYGPDADYGMRAFFTEEASPVNDFLGTTCQEWEASIQPVENMNIRLVKLRTGIVLSSRGGALAEYIKPMRKGVAPIMGNGKQTVSWIHELDLVRMIQFAISHDNISGVYNAVAPKPVTNKELIYTLKVLYPMSTISVKVPSFVLSIMLGELKVEVLKSVTVSGKKISDAGFQFMYPMIEPAIAHLIRKR